MCAATYIYAKLGSDQTFYKKLCTQLAQVAIDNGASSDLAVKEQVDCETNYPFVFFLSALVGMVLNALTCAYFILVLYTHWMNSDMPV